MLNAEAWEIKRKGVQEGHNLYKSTSPDLAALRTISSTFLGHLPSALLGSVVP